MVFEKPRLCLEVRRRRPTFPEFYWFRVICCFRASCASTLFNVAAEEGIHFVGDIALLTSEILAFSRIGCHVVKLVSGKFLLFGRTLFWRSPATGSSGEEKFPVIHTVSEVTANR